MSPHTDLLGAELTPQDRELLDVYQALKRLAADPTQPPCVERNVKKVHIINGKIPHGLLLEIFTDKGIGTEIVRR